VAALDASFGAQLVSTHAGRAGGDHCRQWVGVLFAPDGRLGLPARVLLIFSRPGKLIDNPFIESFNGRLRDEHLNVELFVSIADAQRKILEWQRDYNEDRPHSSFPLGSSRPSGRRRNPPPRNILVFLGWGPLRQQAVLWRATTGWFIELRSSRSNRVELQRVLGWAHVEGKLVP